jgi:hypothetical protein
MPPFLQSLGIPVILDTDRTDDTEMQGKNLKKSAPSMESVYKKG